MTNNITIKKQLKWLLLAIIIIEVLSWYCLKKQYISGNKIYLVFFFLLYAMIPFLLIQTLKYEGIGITNMLWNIASTILVLIIGYFIFKEQINGYQYIGIGLGILSIVLLSMSNN